MARRLLVTCLVCLLAVPAADAMAAPKRFFGVALQTHPSDAEYQLMARGGTGRVRVLLDWSKLQRQPGGPIDYSSIDEFVSRSANAGVDVTFFFFGTPLWAAACGKLSPDICERTLATRTAAGTRGWRQFVAATAARYGPRGSFWSDATDSYAQPYRPVREWQVGNEANSPTFAPPRPLVRAYAKLVKITAAKVRRQDRRARIVLGGLFATPPRPGISAWAFLDKLYQVKKMKAAFDTVALHPYSPNIKGIAYQLRRIRKVMVENRDSKARISITELGWGSAGRASAPNQNGRLLKGMKGQASMLRKAFRFLVKSRKRYRLRNVFWFAWRDLPAGQGGACYFCESAGLLDAAGTVKPAWSKFAQAAGGKP